MAKRKLSPKQRLAVRKDIKLGLAQKKKPALILQAVSEKYGITTITARWYMKSLAKPAASITRRKATKRRAGRPRLSRRNSQRLSLKGAAMSLVHEVQSIAAKTLKRALEVKKLIPKWHVYVKKEASLRQLESKVKSKLQKISTKAAALQRRIQALNPK